MALRERKKESKNPPYFIFLFHQKIVNERGNFVPSKNRERSIVNLCEHLGYCRLVQNSPFRTIF